MTIKHKKVILLVAVLAICMVGFLSISIFLTKPTENQKGTLLGITLEIVAPFSSAKLIVSEDASAEYLFQQTNQPAKSETYNAGTFSSLKLIEIHDMLIANKFFDLHD